MTRKLRWGVIGAGGIARRRTIPEGIVRSEVAELVALYDRTIEVTHEVAETYSAIPCSTIEELLKTDIDAVYIATPTFLHPEQVASAARAGKHILCEKPMANTGKDASRMVEECRRYGVHLSPAFMMRFHPAHRRIKELVAGGAIGTPVSARAQLSCWFPASPRNWRHSKAEGGGGCIPDLASHCLDLLSWFFGKTSAVSAFCGRRVHEYEDREVEDTAVALIRFASGVIATVDTFFSVPDSACDNVLEIYGSRGAIKCRGTLGQEAIGEMRLTTVAAHEDSYDARQSRREKPSRTTKYDGEVSLYQCEIDSFSQSILAGHPPTPDAADGETNSKIIEALYRAAGNHQVVVETTHLHETIAQGSQ